MACKIKWSPQAAAHLREICNFNGKDSKYHSSFFAKRVLTIVESLAHFPKSGRIVPEYQDENIRERICGNYRIVYRLKEGLVEIAVICHGAKPLNG